MHVIQETNVVVLKLMTVVVRVEIVLIAEEEIPEAEVIPVVVVAPTMAQT